MLAFLASLTISVAYSRIKKSLPTSTSPNFVEHFIENGYCIVPLLSPSETETLREEVLNIIQHRTGARPVYHPPYTLDYLHSLHKTISSKLSSTAGAGGVMDVHHDALLDEIRTDPRIFNVIRAVWGASYGSSAPGFALPPSVRSSFDFTRGYCTIDRICLRCPDDISNFSGRKKRATKCLTPHLDCCPESVHDDLLPPPSTTLHDNSGPIPPPKPCRMWRPIQCFLLLSDNLSPSTGGIELAPGHHLTFPSWSRNRTSSPTQLCFGPFTAIRSASLTSSISHIPVPSGSLFLWDEKIPHSTSLAHLGREGRVAVYLGYLPSGGCNDVYKAWERLLWEGSLVWVGGGQNWITASRGGEGEGEEDEKLRERGFVREARRQGGEPGEGMGELGRRLMGLDDWPPSNRHDK